MPRPCLSLLAACAALIFVTPAGAAYFAPTPIPAKESVKRAMLGILSSHNDSWFKVRVSISETGQVTDAEVLEKYPANISDAAFLREVKKMAYEPARFDGVPVASESGFVMSHSTTASHDIRRKNSKAFQSISDMITNGGDADSTLADLKDQYDRGKLSLAEVARYFALLESVERRTGKFREAMDAANNALSLHDFLETQELVDYLNMEKVQIYMHAGQPANAIDYYDSWVRETHRSGSPDMIDAIEKQRKLTPGRHYSFQIDEYRDDHFAGNHP